MDVLANKSELQVEIDDIYSCLGGCSGCTLTDDERYFSRRVMDKNVLDLVFSRLKDYIAFCDNIDYMNISFGIADHLLLSRDRIIDLRKKIDYLLSNIDIECGIFFTVSLVGQNDRIIDSLNHVSSAWSGLTVYPVCVLDVEKMNLVSYGSAYKERFNYAKDLFGRIDLSVTLSPESITKESPSGLIDFALSNGFNEITLNWTPVRERAVFYTAEDIKKMSSWLTDFLKLSMDFVHCSYQPVIRKLILATRNNGVDFPSFVRDILFETISRSIQFDVDGNLLPKFEAIGDIPYSPRFGFSDFGNVRDGSISSLIEKNIDNAANYVIFEHMKNGLCASCEYLKVCAGAGFHIYIKNFRHIKNSDLECPIGVKQIIRHIDQNI